MEGQKKGEIGQNRLSRPCEVAQLNAENKIRIMQMPLNKEFMRIGCEKFVAKQEF